MEALVVVVILLLAIGIFSGACYAFYANKEEIKKDVGEMMKATSTPSADEVKKGAPAEPKPDDELRDQIKKEVLAEIEEKNEEKSSKGTRILAIALVAIQNIFLISALDWENVLGLVTFLLGIVGIVLLLVSFKDPVGKMTPMISVSLTCLTIEMVFLGVPPLGSLGVVFVLLDALGVYNKLRKRKK